MRAMALLSLILLASCGADGPPVAPPAKVDKAPGITISGQARVGVVTCVKGPGC